MISPLGISNIMYMSKALLHIQYIDSNGFGYLKIEFWVHLNFEISTLETQFSEPRFSEILDLMNNV